MRIVVKVGTSTLAYPTGRLNIQRMERLCKTLSDLKNAGHEIILVSSGAIAMGFGKLNLRERPKDMPTKQASAAVGQCELMYVYDKLFTEYNHTVAQLLITAPDIADGGSRKENFHNTLDRLLELGALPVINENDTVATDEVGVENTIGENDTLSAIVAAAVHADLLILLSDIDGLYDGDPHKDANAHLISTVPAVDEHILALGGGSGSSLGTSRMRFLAVSSSAARLPRAARVFFRMSRVVMIQHSFARNRVPTGFPSTMSYSSAGLLPLAMTISQPASVAIWAAASLSSC